MDRRAAKSAVVAMPSSVAGKREEITTPAAASRRWNFYLRFVYIETVMQPQSRRFGGPELLIFLGAGVFIFVLALSAYFEADIRWLHFFQAFYQHLAY